MGIMFENTQPQGAAREENPYEEALKAAIRDWIAGGKRSQADKALVLALASRVSPERSKKILIGLESELTARTSRGGRVFQNVVNLIDKYPEWTAANLRKELESSGLHVDAKTFTNCIDYLVRAGRLTRISRGHYAVAGFGVVTTDDLFPSYDIPKGGENED
ncbi:MAG: type IV toxin-antitoxin system AbiEi family antitoxin domain-containing protein [Hyphomicrobiales bacterium]|nr:type IV toxin-antitoxin system AbiEi family antitoxin domain-containing protein [Hyphomicrobiales bacterium]